MKLSQDQIQELFRFTRAHYVEYYDLQLELVDHLANGIESQWEENPKLTFEQAKNKEFKKFGVFGFQDVIKERSRAMSKRYWAIIWSYFKEWWSLPKIIATLAFILGVFIVLNLLPNGDLKIGLVAGVFLGFTLLMLYRSFQLRRHMEGMWRKWMFQEKIYEQGLLVQLFLLPMHLWNLQWVNSYMGNIYLQMGLAVLIVTMGILFKICGFVIPSKAEKLLAEAYPEYNIS